MIGLTYDTGALLAAEARSFDVWTIHEDALKRELMPVVPAVALAQAWRGGPQPVLSRFLRGCVVEQFAEHSSPRVGAALARTRTRDVVDAAVVISALASGNAVVTSDPEDLRRLAEALGMKLLVHAI